MTEIFGSLAGVAASLSWAISILLFERALRRYGALVCNLFKAVFAAVLFVLSSACLFFVWDYGLPTIDARTALFISGVIGMAFGDFAFFQAIVHLGPRQAALIHSTNPVFLLLFSLWVPSDTLTTLEMLGVLVVILAVGDVTRNQKRRNGQHQKNWTAGLVWGFLAAISQAVGIVVAKDAAMENHAIHTGMFRLLGASMGMILGLVVLTKGRAAIAKLKEPELFRLAGLPVVLGTFFGIMAMMVAIAASKPAVAGATLSLAPVFLVPLTAWKLKERIPIRILIGTIFALIGVIMISS
jgi:drug/metabolite transporter (DMT)-like permease